MGVFLGKVFVNLYLVIPLVAILATLLIEVEEYAIFVIIGGLHHGMASMDTLTGGDLFVS